MNLYLFLFCRALRGPGHRPSSCLVRGLPLPKYAAMRHALLTVACLLLFMTLTDGAASERQGFDRSAPASQWTAGAIERLREAPAAGFADTLDEARAALAIPARAAQGITYEGHLPTDPKRLASVEDLREVSRVRACIIAWLRTGDQAFATRAWAGVMAWVTTYRINGNAINENKLSSLVSAWGLLRHDADPEQRQQADHWFQALAQAQIDTAAKGRAPLTNNWHTKRLRLVALIGVPLANDTFLTWARDGLLSFSAGSIDENGVSHDFRERDSLGYHCGMLAPLLEILVALGEPEHYARRGDAGGSARNAVHFLLPYAKGERTHGEFVNSRVEIDCRRAEAGIAQYQPGTPWERQRGAKVLGLAAAFEPELARLAEELARLAGEWPNTDALLAAVQPWKP